MVEEKREVMYYIERGPHIYTYYIMHTDHVWLCLVP